MSYLDLEPPFTYDDIRVTYDDACVTYDGDLSADCQPSTSKRIGGGRGGVAIGYGRPHVPPPAPNPLIDIRIKTCLKKVNNDVIDNECIQKHWKREIPLTLVKTKLSSVQKAHAEIHAEITSVQPAEKTLLSTGEVKVTPVAPSIQIIEPIKKTIRESISVVSTSTIKQPSKIYLRKSIIVVPKPKE